MTGHLSSADSTRSTIVDVGACAPAANEGAGGRSQTIPFVKTSTRWMFERLLTRSTCSSPCGRPPVAFRTRNDTVRTRARLTALPMTSPPVVNDPRATNAAARAPPDPLEFTGSLDVLDGDDVTGGEDRLPAMRFPEERIDRSLRHHVRVAVRGWLAPSRPVRDVSGHGARFEEVVLGAGIG